MAWQASTPVLDYTWHACEQSEDGTTSLGRYGVLHVSRALIAALSIPLVFDGCFVTAFLWQLAPRLYMHPVLFFNVFLTGIS